MPTIYINKEEQQAVEFTSKYINKVLEGSSTVFREKEDKEILSSLLHALEGLRNIESKILFSVDQPFRDPKK